MTGFYVIYLESEFNMVRLRSATHPLQAFAGGVIGNPQPTSVSVISTDATALEITAK